MGAPKPAKKIFDVAFEKMRFPGRDKVLMVGDKLTSDIQGGLNYGIDTCWYNPEGHPSGQTKPTHEIRRLSELRKLTQ